MKKVLLFLFFIISVFVANSQTLRPSQLPTTNAAGRFDITGYQMDSAFLYVLRDSFPAKYPSVIYHPNGNLYKTTGGAGAHWNLVTDTTWLSNRIDLKLNIADTAAMLSNYLRKTDTANLVAPYMKYSDTSNMLTPYHQSFYTATFDTATRILTMYPITGTVPTILTIPRGGTISGITTLTPYRVPGSDVQYLVADNGDAPGFTLKTADSATIMHFSDTATMLAPYAHSQAVVKYYDTSAMLSKYVRYTDTANIVANRLKISDTATMLSNRLKISDTANMLAGYKTYYPRTAISGGSGITYDPVTGIISNGSPSSGGTVTSVSAGVGMNFTTITTTGPVNADTLVLSTRLHVDSIAMRKLNLTDTAAMLSNRLKISDTATMLRNHATYAETLTGKNISGSVNNLSNIANSSLVNSTISGIPLGSNLAALTNGFGITSLSYNGSTAKAVIVDTSSGGVATWALLKKKIDSASAAGGGSVSSVGLVLPTDVFTVTGSPVTTSGNLTGTFKTQTANKVFASDTSGSAAQPTFRALVAADLPDTYLPISDTAAMLSNRLKISDTATMLSGYGRKGFSVQYTDTSAMFLRYFPNAGGGGGNFIKNQTSQQTSANFNIDGTGIANQLTSNTNVKAIASGTGDAYLFRGTKSDGSTDIATFNQTGTGDGGMSLSNTSGIQKIFFNAGGVNFVNSGFPLLVNKFIDDSLHHFLQVKGTAYADTLASSATISSMVKSDVSGHLINATSGIDYLSPADSLSGGYTTWDLTKKKIDSLAYALSGTGYVPYNGATSAVNLGSNSLTAGAISGTTGTFSGDITLSSASRSIVFNTTNTLLWESGGSLRMRTGGVDALIINSSQAATFASSVTVGSDLYLPNGSSIYIGNTTYRLSTWNTSGDLYLGDVDNGYNNVIIRSGGADRLTFTNAGAATFASSVTVGSDLYLPNASSIYIGNTTYRLSTWHTSGDLYLGDVDNGYNNVIIRSGGADRLTFTNAGAATFASSVTASSLIKSGGTSSQLLAADGSVVTAGTNVTISGGTISASGGLNGNTGIISAQTTDQTITTYTPGSNGVYLVGGTFDVTAISGSNMEMYVEWTDQNSVSRSFALRSGVSAIQNNVFAPFSVTAKSGTAINIKVHFLSGSSATYDASAYIKSMN